MLKTCNRENQNDLILSSSLPPSLPSSLHTFPPDMAPQKDLMVFQAPWRWDSESGSSSLQLH